jgi:dynactin 1
MQSLVRTLRAKDQSIQETAVKIELMERRLEASKKQADTISELESELAKARKQESAYEEAMEQLQSDLDVLEKDNAKLKAAAVAHPERQGEVSHACLYSMVVNVLPSAEVQRPEVEAVAVEGSLETSYLLEQVNSA